MTELEEDSLTFAKWLTTAEPGDSVIYYNGNLAGDRGDCETFPRRAERTPLLDQADAAWLAAKNGFVNLVQHAIGPLRANGTHVKFIYIAQRTSKVRRADPPAAYTSARAQELDSQPPSS